MTQASGVVGVMSDRRARIGAYWFRSEYASENFTRSVADARRIMERAGETVENVWQVTSAYYGWADNQYATSCKATSQIAMLAEAIASALPELDRLEDLSRADWIYAHQGDAPPAKREA